MILEIQIKNKTLYKGALMKRIFLKIKKGETKNIFRYKLKKIRKQEEFLQFMFVHIRTMMLGGLKQQISISMEPGMISRGQMFKFKSHPLLPHFWLIHKENLCKQKLNFSKCGGILKMI